MTSLFRSIYLLLFISVLYSPGAKAQNEVITLKFKYESKRECSSDSGITFLTFHIRPDIVRLDFKGPTSNSSIIYQPSSERLWALYHHEKRYFAMTAEDIEMVERQIKGAKEEMIKSQEALTDKEKNSAYNLWPTGTPFDVDNPTYIQVKKKDSLVSQLMCKRYDGKLKDGKVKRVYIHNLKSTGLKDDELSILTAFSDFMGDGVRILAQNMEFTSFKKWDVGGYPILIETRSEEVLCSQLLLKEIYRQKRKDDFFTIPVYYGVIDNPMGRTY